jgi:hypothetical protein
MYSRSAKGGEKGDSNRNPWLVKMLNMLKMPCFKNFKKEKRRTFWDDHDIPVRNLDVPDLESDNFQSGLEII